MVDTGFKSCCRTPCVMCMNASEHRTWMSLPLFELISLQIDKIVNKKIVNEKALIKVYLHNIQCSVNKGKHPNQAH